MRLNFENFLKATNKVMKGIARRGKSTEEHGRMLTKEQFEMLLQRNRIEDAQMWFLVLYVKILLQKKSVVD